jgi:FlaA1/EpsC-like NDP-sugar epimerase
MRRRKKRIKFTLNKNGMHEILNLVGRDKFLFGQDVLKFENELAAKVSGSSFLVIGGAGSVGQAITCEIFRRDPRKLHVVDISENNLVELVRDLRSTFGYQSGEFKTFCLDVDSLEFDSFLKCAKRYDYVLNLSALKHVRSEKDPFTLMRLVNTNIINAIKICKWAANVSAIKYFCVSTDKAADPVNMMGASKKIMEMFTIREAENIAVSMSRFANVAFSDGSLLYGYNKRMEKRQPLVAPNDVKRYFMTPQESGQLCLISCLLGINREIFFPKLDRDLYLTSFAEIVCRYLTGRGFEPYICESENQARSLVADLSQKGQWPCFFSPSDTTGEKDCEQFFVEGEEIDLSRFLDIGVIQNSLGFNSGKLDDFEKGILRLRSRGSWEREEIVELFSSVIPSFKYVDLGKYLDDKM